MYSSEQWRNQAAQSLQAAQLLFDEGRYRDCASRAYYAAYQAATSICVAHGDSTNFPTGWNNPSHEQLPELILNNGGFTRQERRTVVRLLRSLRTAREDADYRPGRTVDKQTAFNSLRDVLVVRRLLRVEND